MLAHSDCALWEALAALADYTPEELAPCLRALHQVHLNATQPTCQALVDMLAPVFGRHEGQEAAAQPAACLPDWLASALGADSERQTSC